ncbi:MAG: nicotinate phosphoribosyltransferase [Thermoanaerobaculia bacterium]|nr:MAG: nicotinate phosphoribosyltransferase [Thermoanaerobaculia bacterium]
MTASAFDRLYRRPLSLLTDLYQVTMALGHFRRPDRDLEAVFHLFFRENPFRGGFALACGLESAVAYLERLRFERDDLDYLARLSGSDDRPLFPDDFLSYLSGWRFRGDVDAVPEGTVVFAHEPLVRVAGPILDAQLVETALLNLVNFPTLIATKAARLAIAAEGQEVVEFGLRRAQGIDGGVTASRAAYVGGCAGTSNLLAAELFGIPARGTHAHSWVSSFESEEEAFRAYAAVQPGNCVLLVDTYDTLEGVRRAARVGLEMRARGARLAGIRLDSGDLAYLSIEARRILDQAGLPEVEILASNNLDEHLVESLRLQGSRIDVWCVGTALATAEDDPALGGVYKLGAIRRPGGEWRPRLKLSEQTAKSTTPGVLGVRRFRRGDGSLVADMIWDHTLGISDPPEIVDPADPFRHRRLPGDAHGAELLEPAVRSGRTVMRFPALAAVREKARGEVAALHPAIRRFLNPHAYPVGLERGLHAARARAIEAARAL